MAIQVGEASPPHRDEMVAEFHVIHDGLVGIPAEMFREDGKLMIAIYSRSGSEPWEFSLAEFLEAIAKGIAVLGG
jgi:hypothetical protein